MSIVISLFSDLNERVYLGTGLPHCIFVVHYAARREREFCFLRKTLSTRHAVSIVIMLQPSTTPVHREYISNRRRHFDQTSMPARLASGNGAAADSRDVE
jgi:hypothetical protein